LHLLDSLHLLNSITPTIFLLPGKTVENGQKMMKTVIESWISITVDIYFIEYSPMTFFFPTNLPRNIIRAFMTSIASVASDSFGA
jgi:hypothetical protein